MKCQNNALFDLRGKDKTLAGVAGLSNTNIKSFTSDINTVVTEYEDHLGDDAARKECLDQLKAVVTHSCGDHSNCKHEKWCSFLRVKNQHPDWTDEEITIQATKESHRPLGKRNMSLAESGIAALQNNIRKRFNENTIDNIASGGCSNLSESFWNIVTKFSEGKRLNQDHTDHYIISNLLTFCRIGPGNIERTHDQISDRLGLAVTSPELRRQAKAIKKRDDNKKRQATDEYKKSRSLAKMSRDHRMGKADNKKMHKSGKVPLTESSKSKASTKTRKQPACTICKQKSHTCRQCIMPPQMKRTVAQLEDLDFDAIDKASKYGIKAAKRCKVDLLDFDDFIF
ncbi:hypothetical protein ACHAXR_004559 [Thalassiosira sp. AJA248-18]